LFMAGLRLLHAESPIEEWTNFKKSFLRETEQDLSSVVVYRPENFSKNRAINVYIDGEYQASLLPGAFTQAVVCPGRHNLVIVYTNISTEYREKKMIGQEFDTKGNRSIFLHIAPAEEGKIRLDQLSSSQATEDIEKLDLLQNHTLSRISKRNCDQPISDLIPSNTNQPISDAKLQNRVIN